MMFDFRMSSWLRGTASTPRKTVSRPKRRVRPTLDRLEGRTLPAVRFELTGFPSPAIAGVAADLTVRAVNADGSTDTMYWRPFHFTSNDPWASLPETSFLTNGIRTFTVMLSTAGARSITATDNATPTLTGSQTGIAVQAGEPSRFLVDGWASPATAGVPHNVTVKAADAFGNVATGYTGTVQFSSSDPQADLPAASTLTNGVGTFSVTLKTAGTQTLTVSDSADPAVTGDLSTFPQLEEVYTQPPNPAGGRDKSAWYPPDGLDSDQYVWDRFIVDSNQAITEVHWRGAYTNYLQGAGLSPVFDFTMEFYRSIAGGSQPDVTDRPLVQYRVRSNAGETYVGDFGGVRMYDYSFTLPTPFRAVAGTKYWIQIEAWQGLTPIYYWPPDWSWAYGIGGNGSHFRHSEHGGYQSISGDTAFTLLTTTNQAGIVVNPGPVAYFYIWPGSDLAGSAVAGQPFDIYIFPYDEYWNWINDYAGDVMFWTSDPLGVVPEPYTFTGEEFGFGIPGSVTLSTPGWQELYAWDMATFTALGYALYDVQASGAPGAPGGGGPAMDGAAVPALTASAPAAPQTKSTPGPDLTPARSAVDEFFAADAGAPTITLDPAKNRGARTHLNAERSDDLFVLALR